MNAILWKEWKGVRWYFLPFLFIAIILPAFQMQSLPGNESVARWLLVSVWAVFAGFLGFAFQMQQRGGRISFLLANPATQPQLFSIHYLVHFLFLIGLIIISLLVHYLDLKLTQPKAEILNILSDPRLLFGLVFCVFIFVGVFLSATASLLIGRAAVGVMLFLLLLVFVMFLNVPHLADGLMTMNPIDDPASFLVISIAAAVLFASFILWVISVDEMRNTRNPRWTTPVIIASVLALVLAVPGGASFKDALTPPLENGFIEEIIFPKMKPYPMVVTVSSNGKQSIFQTRPGAENARPFRFYLSKLRVQNAVAASFTDILPRIFSPYRYQEFRSSFPKVIFLSDLPVWGKDIRSIATLSGKTEIIVPRDYAQIETIGIPFLSPDQDRIAYLKRTSSRFEKKSSRSICISSTFGLATGSVDLSGDSGVEYAPIGWTPDGDYFMFRKEKDDGAEILALDWLAQGVQPFLEAYKGGMITEDDLPKAGEWMSLVQPQEYKKQYELWLINYGSSQNVQVGIFEETPRRVWSESGTWFSCWSPGKGLLVYRLDDNGSPKQVATCPDVSVISQMKWTPVAGKLALVTSESGAAAGSTAGNRLVLFDPMNCTMVELISDFSSNEKQWGWATDFIVYAQERELWQVDLTGKKTLITSVEALE